MIDFRVGASSNLVDIHKLLPKMYPITIHHSTVSNFPYSIPLPRSLVISMLLKPKDVLLLYTSGFCNHGPRSFPSTSGSLLFAQPWVLFWFSLCSLPTISWLKIPSKCLQTKYPNVLQTRPFSSETDNHVSKVLFDHVLGLRNLNLNTSKIDFLICFPLPLPTPTPGILSYQPLLPNPLFNFSPYPIHNHSLQNILS